MSLGRRMIDIAEVLLHDIQQHDEERQRKGISRSDRSSATVMRRIGLSDEEIVERLGYNPLENEPTEAPEVTPKPGQ